MTKENSWIVQLKNKVCHSEVRNAESTLEVAAATEGFRMTPALYTMRGKRYSVIIYRLNSSRSRLVWARLTGISVCRRSSMRNW